MEDRYDIDKCKKALEVCRKLIDCRRAQLKDAKDQFEFACRRAAALVSFSELKVDEALFFEKVCESFSEMVPNTVDPDRAYVCHEIAERFAQEILSLTKKVNESRANGLGGAEKDEKLWDSLCRLLEEVQG